MPSARTVSSSVIADVRGRSPDWEGLRTSALSATGSGHSPGCASVRGHRLRSHTHGYAAQSDDPEEAAHALLPRPEEALDGHRYHVPDLAPGTAPERCRSCRRRRRRNPRTRPARRSPHPTTFDLGGGNTAASTTRTRNTVNDETLLRATSDGAGAGLEGISGGGFGVYGSSTSGTAVYGISNYFGVYGSSPSGTAVVASSTSGTSVYATSTSGPAFIGESGSDSAPALRASALGGTTGLHGHSGLFAAPDAPANTGVFGSADLAASSVGVRGWSPTGRGGRFAGEKAQIRLDPSAATSHPPSGQGGDLFVDKNKRLWFCKGGKTWVRLA